MNFALPVHVPPMVQALSNYGDFFTILPCCRDYQNWIICHYANVVYRHHEEKKYEFSFCDPLYEQCELMDFDLVCPDQATISADTVVPILKAIIESGCYVYVEINQFFISNSLWYQKADYVHRQLFYGFSDSEDGFLSVGYDKTMHYSKAIVPYRVLAGAMFDQKGNIAGKIHTIRSNDASYCFNKGKIYNSFFHYVNSTFDGIPEFNDYEFGFTAMEKMHDLIDASKKWTFYDMRPLTMFYEHKKLQYEKLKIISLCYASIESKFILRAEEIMKLSYQVLLLYLKVGMSRNTSSIKYIHELINQINEKEHRLYPELLSLLS